MLGNLLVSLRKELTPLVEAKLREELAPKIRAELEEVARARTQVQIDSEMLRRAEEARSNLEGEVSNQLFSLTQSLEELRTSARQTVTSVFDASACQELRERLTNEVNLLVSTRIETLRNEMKTSMRSELEPSIREEISQELRPAIDREIRLSLQAEKERLTKIFREGLLLQHVKEREIDLIRDQVRRQLKREVYEQLKRDLGPHVQSALLLQLREKVEDEHRVRLTDELRSKVEAELTPKVHQELRSKLELAVRRELASELTSEVEEKLTRELRLALVLSLDGSVSPDVASVLRQNMSGMTQQLRELILDEIWSSVTSSILEALAVVLELDDEQWEYYVERARELVDDRIQGNIPGRRRKLAQPDGFYRAIDAIPCSRSDEMIETGSYYLVFKGYVISLAYMNSLFDELVDDSVNGRLDNKNDEVAPPWSGLPWD